MRFIRRFGKIIPISTASPQLKQTYKSVLHGLKAHKISVKVERVANKMAASGKTTINRMNALKRAGNKMQFHQQKANELLKGVGMDNLAKAIKIINKRGRYK